MTNTNIDELLLTNISNTIKKEPEQEPIINNEAYSEPQDSSISTPEKEPDIEPIKESENDTDDYGTKIEKKERTYTQSELNEIMRDRNARSEYARREAEQQAAQQVTQNSQKPQQNEDGSWENELESFIENTLSKRDQKIQQQTYQQTEQRLQQDFEIKFNNGAAKYNDFETVVMGKPLTPQMLIATRGMEDPAAFIYAASKNQAPELDRISKIYDPYAQAIELGRLEERMKKNKSSVSSAPRPIAQVRGDVSSEKPKAKNIDDILVAEDRNRRKTQNRNR